MKTMLYPERSPEGKWELIEMRGFVIAWHIRGHMSGESSTLQNALDLIQSFMKIAQMFKDVARTYEVEHLRGEGHFFYEPEYDRETGRLRGCDRRLEKIDPRNRSLRRPFSENIPLATRRGTQFKNGLTIFRNKPKQGSIGNGIGLFHGLI